MNYFRTSDGTKVSKSTIDYRVREAKKKKLKLQIEEKGYNVCEECGRNDCKPIDCSHDESVDWCQNNGCVELAWNLNNITIRGRKCHKIKDTNLILSGKS